MTSSTSDSPTTSTLNESTDEANPIGFFGIRDRPYGAFSNFYPCILVIDQLRYDTVEHYFQSQKYATTCPAYAELIRMARTPNQAKQLAWQRANTRWSKGTVKSDKKSDSKDIGQAIQAKTLTTTIANASADTTALLIREYQQVYGTAVGTSASPSACPSATENKKDSSKRIESDPEWNERRDQVMLLALRHKFAQNADLAKLLLSTGDRKLEERSPYDDYWGTGKTGQGQNRLGHLLQVVRIELNTLEASTLQHTALSIPCRAAIEAPLSNLKRSQESIEEYYAEAEAASKRICHNSK